jgi:hypothetical protein
MYTLLHTKAVEDTMLSDYFEHCYEERVLVRGRCTITNNPNTISQLKRGYQFEPLAEYQTKEEAETAREHFIKHGVLSLVEEAPPVVEEPVIEKIADLPKTPRIKIQKIMKDRAEAGGPDMQVPWFGNNLKIVREKEKDKDGA